MEFQEVASRQARGRMADGRAGGAHLRNVVRRDLFLARAAAGPCWRRSAASSVAWHMSLQHEIIHNHPTRSRRVNRALGAWPLALWLPFESLPHHPSAASQRHTPDRSARRSRILLSHRRAMAALGPLGRALFARAIDAARAADPRAGAGRWRGSGRWRGAAIGARQRSATRRSLLRHLHSGDAGARLGASASATCRSGCISGRSSMPARRWR